MENGVFHRVRLGKLRCHVIARCGKIKIPPCLKAVNAEQRRQIYLKEQYFEAVKIHLWFLEMFLDLISVRRKLEPFLFKIVIWHRPLFKLHILKKCCCIIRCIFFTMCLMFSQWTGQNCFAYEVTWEICYNHLEKLQVSLLSENIKLLDYCPHGFFMTNFSSFRWCSSYCFCLFRQT